MGGAERYLFDLSRKLTDSGHTVIHFSTQDRRNFHSPYAKYFAKGTDSSQYQQNTLFSNIFYASRFIYSLEARKKIVRIIDEYKPDVVHLHNIYHHLSSSILQGIGARKIPVVMTLHDYKLICPNYSLFTENSLCYRCKSHAYYNAVTHRCVKNSYLASCLACIEMYFSKLLRIYEKGVNLFIAPSQFMKEKMIDFGIAPEKIFYLPYALNLTGFTPHYKEGKYILYFGRLTAKKGVETLLQSAKKFRSMPIKIAGAGSERKNLERFVGREKITNVEFLGYKTKHELVQLIAESLFVVVPSRWHEVMGLTIYEAFASGKCVIASDSGGIPELVEDRVNGLFFRAGDAQALTEKIQYLLSHPYKRIEWGKNAFKKIQAFNDLEAHSKELLRLYTSLMRKYQSLPQ